jgi:hypothetical protein
VVPRSRKAAPFRKRLLGTGTWSVSGHHVEKALALRMSAAEADRAMDTAAVPQALTDEPAIDRGYDRQARSRKRRRWLIGSHAR